MDILIWCYCRKNNPGEVVIQSENGERRVLRSTPDWTEEAVNGDHLWVATSASGDLCYVDQECTVYKISFPPWRTTRPVTILLYDGFHVVYRRPLNLPISDRSAGREPQERYIFSSFFSRWLTLSHQSVFPGGKKAAFYKTFYLGCRVWRMLCTIYILWPTLLIR